MGSHPYALSRRRFLQGLAAGAVLGVPTVLGYSAYRVSAGVPPVAATPFADLANGRLAGAEGVPLLVLINEEGGSRFAGYLPEILRAEGLACFETRPLSWAASAEMLRPYAMVLVSSGPPAAAQAVVLEEYVHGGGRLIAFQPGEAFAHMSNSTLASRTADARYMTVDPIRCPLWMPTPTTQLHAPADLYHADAGAVLAWLGRPGDQDWTFPAVMLSPFGQGLLSVWSFDLAESIVLTRQGNPEWANMERDGREGIRAHDMFVDWIDLSLIEYPQVDLQMRFLSRLIHEMLADALPLPRLWYFPGNAPSMLVATGDAHASPTAGIEDLLGLVESHGGQMSIYYSPPLESSSRRMASRAQGWLTDQAPAVVPDSLEATLPTRNTVMNWRARRHEFGLHPYVEEGLEAGWERYWQAFTGSGYGPVSMTTRTHAIQWSGWAETARVQASFGIQMNLDYYHYGPAFQRSDGSWSSGYFTGSGLPMRFADDDGRVLQIYQQATQLVDEHLMQMPWGLGGSNGSAADAVAVAADLLGRAVDGWPSAVAAQFHVDPFVLGSELRDRSAEWIEGTLRFCNENSIPIVTADSLCAFAKVRDSALFSDVQWDADAGVLSFQTSYRSIFSGTVASLGILLPMRFGGRTLEDVEWDGNTLEIQQRTLAGMDYGVVTLAARGGRVEAAYGSGTA